LRRIHARSRHAYRHQTSAQRTRFPPGKPLSSELPKAIEDDVEQELIMAAMTDLELARAAVAIASPRRWRRIEGITAVVLRQFGEHRLANLLTTKPEEYARIRDQ
jgi:hypothetical protein